MSVSRLSRQSIQAGFPKQQSVWDGITQPAVMDPLSSIVLTGSQASVNFNNIPQTYTHLQIRWLGVNDDTTNSGLGNVRVSGFFNNDLTATNYYNHYVIGDGGSASAGNENSAKFFGNAVRNSMSGPGINIVDILDYANTNKTKTVRTLTGFQNNDTAAGNQGIRFLSGMWNNTVAINAITIVPESGNFKIYSNFALYGIK